MANQLASDYQQLLDRIEALESRNAFQDDVIEQLNQELAIHQQEISEFKQQIKLLASRIKSATPDAGLRPQDEPPPPHY